ASGYDTDSLGNIVNADFISMTQPHAAGSLLSTTGDLVEWHGALTGGEFIHDDSYRRMTSPVTLNNSDTLPYGYGLGITTMRGHLSNMVAGFTAFPVFRSGSRMKTSISPY
ncbi:MAG: hypothetical protein ACKVJN_11195, partial [Woeseiales bacterium]